jgi:DNA repair protein RadD
VGQVLRDYQERGIADMMRAFREGAQSILLVSPTGSGKTTLFTHVVSQLATAGHRSLIAVHRRELATQASNRLTEFGTDFGFILSGMPSKPYAKVQVGSVQTLMRRTCPPASLVVFDEAHLSTAKTWQAVRDQYPRARILGVTATPWRLSGKPLVGAYDECIVVATPRQLREAGHLCDYVGFSYRTPDLSDVKTTAGDYNERESAAAMSQSVIVDNVVQEWGKHARELSTVVFAVTVEHSKTLTASFRAAGVTAEHLDGSTPTLERDAILKRVADGKTRVLCNVGVAVEGLDIPRLKCCVLARPTKSLARAIQMMGRSRRPWQGVTARIHDHAFVIKQHGLPDADRDYSLSAKPEAPPSLTTCSTCLALYSGTSCPACGGENEPEPMGERVLNTIADAEQWEFSSESEVAPSEPLPPVEITWNKPGRVLEGKLMSRRTEQTTYGPRYVYALRAEKRDYVFPGTTHLNALLTRVQIPDSMVRITYLEEQPIGAGRSKKLFKVEVDDGA